MTGLILDSEFRPDPLLRGGHAQTIVAAMLRAAPRIDWRWERLELADGDFVDLAWHGPAPGEGPLVLLLHGVHLRCGRAGPREAQHAELQ